MADPGNISAIVSDLAWPAVAICALVILRSPLAGMLTRVTNFRMVAGKVKLEAVLYSQLPPDVAREVLRKPQEYLSAQRREVTCAAQLSGRTGWPGPVIILSAGEPGCRPEPKGSYDQSETDACPDS